MDDGSHAPLRAAVGAELSRFTMPVDVSKAREMALVLGSRVRDWAGSAPADLEGVEVVPTFSAVSGFWQDRRALISEGLGLDLARVLHGEQRWVFERRPVVGDFLRGLTVLADVTEREGRRGGRMRLVTLATAYADADGSPVLREEMVLVETSPTAGDGSPPAGPPRATPAAAAPQQGSRPLGVPRTYGPVTRTDVVRYAGASGDFNRIHHDEPYARDRGLPAVFAMGMLQGGMLAAYLDDHLAGRGLRSLAIRFRQRLWPGDTVRLEAALGESTEDGQACTLRALGGDGAVLVTGTALLAPR